MINVYHMNLKREPNLNRGLVSGSHVSFSEFDYNFFLSYTYQWRANKEYPQTQSNLEPPNRVYSEVLINFKK